MLFWTDKRRLEKENRALRSELLELRSEVAVMNLKHGALSRKWNELVNQINRKGGQRFLDGMPAAQLSADDVRKLLMLCHPDKHGGKQMAHDMTAKLLAMRNS
jgi:hypothetical protein